MHAHTLFCDGADDVEAMCRAAAERGLCSLGFSGHAPLPAGRTGLDGSWLMPPENLEPYAAAVREAAARWRGRLPVYLGLEIDFIEGICSPSDGRFRALGLDFCVGSVHFLVPPNGARPFTVDGPYEEWERGVDEGYGGDAEAAAEAYWAAMEALVRSGGFDVLGHLDLVRKNNRGAARFDEAGPRYRAAAGRAVAAIREELARAERPFVVEVNTGAMNRGTLSEPYPSAALLRDLAAAGVPLTVNADAHRAAHVDGHYEEARRAMGAVGYRSAMVWTGRWEAEPLGD